MVEAEVALDVDDARSPIDDGVGAGTSAACKTEDGDLSMALSTTVAIGEAVDAGAAEETVAGEHAKPV